MIKRLGHCLIDPFHVEINRFYPLFMRSQWWDRERLVEYQFTKLRELSKHYYNLKIKTWEDFLALPTTTREDLQRPIPIREQNTIVHSTSGSTGRPIVFNSPKELEGVKPAIFQRAWNWIGRKREMVLRLTAGDPQWSWYDWLRNVKPLNYRKITKKHLKFIVKNLPFLIHGQCGAIREITSTLIKQKQHLAMRQINLYLMSEDTGAHKRYLSHFYRNIYQGYGLAELCTVASECSHHNLHVNMETAIVEIINGEIVITDPLNYVTPLLRYRTGDLGRLRASDCPCGRQHDILYNVQGREIDYYDGPEVKRPIGWWCVSPIAHRYGHLIKAWQVCVYPKKGIFCLYYVLRNEHQVKNFTWYRDFIKEETGLDFIAIKHFGLPNWKRYLLKVKM